MSEVEIEKQGKKPKACSSARASVLCTGLALLLWALALGSGLLVGNRFFYAIGDLCFHIALFLVAAGFVLGLTAIVAILFTVGHLRGTRRAVAGILLAIAGLCFLAYTCRLAGPMFCRGQCQSNLNSIYQLLQVYSFKNQGNLPTASSWCDLLLRDDLATENQFICRGSKAKQIGCSYALNKNVADMKGSQAPPDLVLLFETRPGWNQFGGPEILSTENHGGKGCNVLFNDGSVRFVPAEQLDRLKWRVEEDRR